VVITINITLNNDLQKNIRVIKPDIKRILAYSAIKIRANPTAPYSMLNPDTSSDSPSAKSKGVRFVSAKEIINHKPIIGINTMALNQYDSWYIIV